MDSNILQGNNNENKKNILAASRLLSASNLSSSEPRTTIAASLEDRTIGTLIVNPHMVCVIPLSNSKLRARLEISNDRVERSPGGTVRRSDNLISIVAPVYLQHDAPGITDPKGANRDPFWCCAEGVIYDKPERSYMSKPYNAEY